MAITHQLHACSLTLTNMYSVLLLTLDTTPLGPFFNQTQSPWCVNKTTQCYRKKKHPEDEVVIRNLLRISRESRLTSNTATLERSGVEAK